ncbi:MAG: DUF3999 domain-containing protein [Gammaproteobacteria bacterium]|nr:DUF3999 domain-containing protein [Gammaproteobacteria bacterium]MBU1732677.1 DUF3999 domain-containing protein [Gammaproteobacteria bacterium]MBU1891502.1 DUF3999 domain-containing protein [Gammaproteobacteria bacterium]
MIRWLLLLFLPFGVQAAESPAVWQHWQYFRTVQLPATPSEWARITLPPDIHGPAQPNLADLRLVDHNDREIPYLLHAQHEQCQRSWRSVPLLDTGFTPGQYSQAVIDSGSEGASHNAVEITTERKDFFTWTEISASDDRVNWRIVREKAPFYRVESTRQNDGTILNYPLTRSRWLRLRFLQGESALQATSARITHEIRTEAERIPLAAAFDSVVPHTEHESTLQTDLERMLPPVSGFRFESSQQEFHRAVRVSSSEDGKNWRTMTHAHIFRHAAADDAKQRAQLELSFPETRARFWRFSILNRNDPALPGLQAQLLTTPRHVVFRPETGQDYRLLYGNPRATPAQYELAQVSKGTQWQTAPIAALGKEMSNTDYVSAAPWSERHPWLLWVALISAVGVLGWIAINALRHGDSGGIQDKKEN